MTEARRLRVTTEAPRRWMPAGVAAHRTLGIGACPAGRRPRASRERSARLSRALQVMISSSSIRAVPGQGRWQQQVPQASVATKASAPARAYFTSWVVEGLGHTVVLDPRRTAQARDPGRARPRDACSTRRLGLSARPPLAPGSGRGHWPSVWGGPVVVCRPANRASGFDQHRGQPLVAVPYPDPRAAASVLVNAGGSARPK